MTLLYALWSLPLVATYFILAQPDLGRDTWLAGGVFAGACCIPAAILPWFFPRYPVHFYGLILAVAIATIIVPFIAFGSVPGGLLAALLFAPLINVFAWPFLLPAWAVAALSVYFACRAGFHVVDGPPKFNCPKCGYSTRGLRDSVCPECGADIFLHLEDPSIHQLASQPRP